MTLPESVTRTDSPSPLQKDSKGYCFCNVQKSYEPEGDRFKIPLEDIRRAYAALGLSFDETAFMEEFIHPVKSQYSDRLESIVSEVTMLKDDDIEAIIGLDRFTLLHPHYYHDKNDRDYEYRIEADCLTGPVATDARTGEPSPMRLSFSAFPRNMRVATKESIMKIREAADAVEVTWKAPLAALALNSKKAPAPTPA